jgi:hypothetical protein
MKILIQLLWIKPYGLFQLRNTFEIMNPFRHSVVLFGREISPMKAMRIMFEY